MTTLPLLADLSRRSVRFSVEGERLHVRGPASLLTDDVRAKLASRKAELLAVLSGEWTRRAVALIAGVADDDARADLAYRFDERAGICEFDGNMSRESAEGIAYEEIAAALRAGSSRQVETDSIVAHDQVVV